jgi:threonine dehydrogenase-like Zn-dependent dehydrogenase
MRPWLVAPRIIEYREQEIDLTPDTLMVRHVCTAPSQGTAIHRYRGEEIALEPYNREEVGGPFPYPWLQGFGYGVGQVEELGKNISGFEIGQLVYCMNLTAELSVVKPSELVPLPVGLDPESASLILQAEVGLKGACAANVILGDTVLITGQGPIGIFAAQLCKLAGAYQVVTTDLSEKRLEIARHVGIDLALNPQKDDIVTRVDEITKGKGADVVVESSGSPEAFLQGCAAAANYAKVVIIGWILDSCEFNMSHQFTPKGLEMVVCHSGQPGDWRTFRRMGRGVNLSQLMREDRIYLMNLMVQGKLKSKEIISHRFPLKELIKVWHEFIDKKQKEYVQVLFVS